MKNKVFAALAIAVIAIFGMLAMQFTSGSPTSTTTTQSLTGAVVGAGSKLSSEIKPQASSATGNVKTFQLSFDGAAYSPQVLRVKLGDKVRIEADTNTLRGCMTTIVAPDFGVRKRISPGDNVIEFTADKAGTFRISCPMGMGNGKIEVEDANGNVPTNIASPPIANSCGSSGGCGCGG
ncbi:MAG: cupredoxin domain-containing protein [Candidatus Micrarchaeota archaeon]